MWIVRSPFLVMALVLLLAFVSPTNTSAQTDAASLERGSVEKRLDTLVEILRVPPDRRSPSVVDAIGREARRMLRYYRNPGQPDEAQQELNSAYAAGLVQALGESRSKKFLPVIIEFAGFGKMGRDAVVNFGEVAIPALLEAANGSENDLHQKSGAMLALAELCRDTKVDAARALSNDNRGRCQEGARALFKSRLGYGDLIAASILALATELPDLKLEVERLATSLEAWNDRGLTDSEAIRLDQNVLQMQLKTLGP